VVQISFCVLLRLTDPLSLLVAPVLFSLHQGLHTTFSLSLFSLLPIVGKFTVTNNLLFISNSTIDTELVIPIVTFRDRPYEVTHNLTFLHLDPQSPSVIQANITSFPAHANLSLTAHNLNGHVGVQLPIDTYEGSVELGSNDGRVVGMFVSWVNSTANPRSPYILSFEHQYEHKDASGTNWADGEVVWRGEGGKSVGIGQGEIVMMTDEGTIFLAAQTDWWGY